MRGGRVLAALLASIAVSASAPAEVAPGTVGEYEVKAAFLYNFAKFVRWPEDAFADEESAFEVCVLGEDPFGRSLDETFAGKEVRNRPTVTRRVDSPAGAGGCHILFVSASEDRRVRWILEELGEQSVLTVGDGEEFAERGGVVTLLLDERRVRFEVNVGAADRARLRVSSQLLNLARRVWGGEGREAAP